MKSYIVGQFLDFDEVLKDLNNNGVAFGNLLINTFDGKFVYYSGISAETNLRQYLTYETNFEIPWRYDFSLNMLETLQTKLKQENYSASKKQYFLDHANEIAEKIGLFDSYVKVKNFYAYFSLPYVNSAFFSKILTDRYIFKYQDLTPEDICLLFRRQATASVKELLKGIIDFKKETDEFAETKLPEYIKIYEDYLENEYVGGYLNFLYSQFGEYYCTLSDIKHRLNNL